jgi:hypothetical protein
VSFYYYTSHHCFRCRIHPRDKLDVGYRLSRAGLAVAYGFQNITYLGPIVADISVASDSSKVNVTYSNVASSSIELRNSNGFEVCVFILSNQSEKYLLMLRCVVMVKKCASRTIQHGKPLQLVESKEHR